MSDDPIEEAVRGHYADQELPADARNRLVAMSRRRGWSLERIALWVAVAAVLVLSVQVARQRPAAPHGAGLVPKPAEVVPPAPEPEEAKAEPTLADPPNKPQEEDLPFEVDGGAPDSDEPDFQVGPIVDIRDKGKGAIREAVVRFAGQLQYCYEKRLRAVRNLEGRIEIAWSITDEAVSNVYLVSNSTGDPELADCLQQKIRRWKFPGCDDGDVSWPFVFRAKEAEE